MMLRDIIWCKLEFTGRFFVHFGWDFYMYVGTMPDTSGVVKQTEAGRLFVERFNSPYGRQPGTAPRIALEIYKADGDEHCQDIELTDVSIDAVRDAIGFSAEHPVYGMFALDPSQVAGIDALIARNTRCRPVQLCSGYDRLKKSRLISNWTVRSAIDEH